MKQITLEYIRGFFDGEGCINLTKKNHNRIGGMIFITNTDKTIIDKISNKLSKLGIKHNINIVPATLIRKTKYSLFISNVYGCYQFYTKIGTAHPEKEIKFKKLFKNSIRLKWILRAKKLKPQIIRLRKKGLTYLEIAQKLNITIDVAQDIGKRFFKSI